MKVSSQGSDSSRKPMKTLEYIQDKTFPNIFHLQFKEGGQLPSILTGMYNSRVEAQLAIDNWVEGHTRKKIYPKAPKNDIPSKVDMKKNIDSPQRSVLQDGEAKNASRV